MPLTETAYSPHCMAGEVVGLDGTRVWPVLPPPRDRLALWAVDGGRDMAAAQLDQAGIVLLIALLHEAHALMQPTAPITPASAAAVADGANTQPATGGTKGQS